MVQMNDVKMVYGNTEAAALNGISFTINEGEFVCLVGPSGSGKTTIIKLITGELSPTSGQIAVNGFDMQGIKRRKLPKLRRTLGVIFQDFRLIDKMTVYENVAFAMRVVGASNKEIRRRVPQVLELVGLADREKRFPAELSGGEQQRVSLARALVNNPKVIIADEPTGNVDPEMSHEIVGLLTKINNAGTTVIMVTHEHDLVRSFQRRVIVIKNGEVVSDTPDPTHAQFTGENPKADTDMFFFDEDVEIDDVNVLPKDDEEDVFDNLENVVSEEEIREVSSNDRRKLKIFN